MIDLYLLEPPAGARWFPFADSRPICELRAGVWLIRERWEAILDARAKSIFAPEHLQVFVEDGVPPVEAAYAVSGPAVIGLSTFAPSGYRLELPSEAARLVHGENTVGWWVPGGSTWDKAADLQVTVDVDGILLDGAYDLVTALEHLLPPDVLDFTQQGGDSLPDSTIVIGDPADVVILGASVEPGVTFDVRGGAVVIEEHCYVKGGTRLEGPVYVGPGTEIVGGQIGWCSIGLRCKVRGETAATVFLGYANKSHEGFVGHSVIGRWANLGAGTVTSNLKNTYGPVRLEVNGQIIETGRQNFGSLIGDHVKTAIGTFLGTGTVAGVGANVFDPVRTGRYIAPFSWGPTGEKMRKDAFLELAERVLPRRQVKVTDDIRRMLSHIYDHSSG